MVLFSKSDLERFIKSVSESIKMTEILIEKDKDNVDLKSMLKTLKASLNKYKGQLKEVKGDRKNE